MSVWDTVQPKSKEVSKGGPQPTATAPVKTVASPKAPAPVACDPSTGQQPQNYETLFTPEVLHRYHIERYLGHGQFGSAFLVRDLTVPSDHPAVHYVAKTMDISSMSPKDAQNIRSEIQCLATCDHLNIIRHRETDQSSTRLVLVAEYGDGGDLAGQIHARRETSQPFMDIHIAVIVTQVLLALDHVHALRILHRDIKPANIFMTKLGLVKLGDFGLSRAYEDSVSGAVGGTLCGTPQYVAPEMWRGEPYSKAADFWSLGVVMFELMALSRPFQGSTLKEISDRIAKGEKIPLPEGHSQELAQICYGLLNMESGKRFGTREVLKFPIMQGALQKIIATISHPKFQEDPRTPMYLEQVKTYLSA